MRCLYAVIAGIALALSGIVHAQSDTADRVHLKNGSILRGTVLEHVMNGNIKIRTSDGSVFVYKSEEVEKIERVEKESPNVRGDAPGERVQGGVGSPDAAGNAASPVLLRSQGLGLSFSSGYYFTSETDVGGGTVGLGLSYRTSPEFMLHIAGSSGLITKKSGIYEYNSYQAALSAAIMVQSIDLIFGIASATIVSRGSYLSYTTDWGSATNYGVLAGVGFRVSGRNYLGIQASAVKDLYHVSLVFY